MPFTVPGFPTFTKFAVENLMPFYNKKNLDPEARHFVNVYLDAINFIKKSKFPIYGIVETSNSAPYVKNLLFSYKIKASFLIKISMTRWQLLKDTKLQILIY